MTDHVHLLVAFRPDRALTPFIRDAKSESARRVNQSVGGRVKWARGCYAGSVSHGQIPDVRAYLASQHIRHPNGAP